MRFVWAVAAFVLAAAMIGAGIAQRTILQGPTTETIDLTVSDDTPYVLIDGDVLTHLPGAQTLRAQGDGTVFAAYGRTGDVKAWLAQSDYTEVSLEGDAVSSQTVEPTTPVAESTAPVPDTAEGEGEQSATDAATDDAAGIAPLSPVGSDLWLDEFQQEDLLIAPLQLPETMSVLVASDGVEPAPSSLSVSWPIENSTPWAGPLIAGGGILMAVGLVLYLLGIRHVRRSRGPRRKGLPLPATQPIDLSIEGRRKGVIAAAPRRRALGARRRLVVLPAIAASMLLVSGCSADAWPDLVGTPTPSPTETVVAPEGQQAPAVTRAQAERILTRISETVAEADATLDPDLAATRLEGVELAERATNYRLRGAIADYASPAMIAQKPLEIVLPQAIDGWPRMFMAVVDDTEGNTASIMTVTQADAWSPYKLSYDASLEASTELPELAPVYVGAARVNPDSTFLTMAPDELAAAYADVLNNGDESEFADAFDTESDGFRTQVAADRQSRLDEFNQTAATTGTLTFASSAGAQEPLALATLESGAIVAVSLNESDTVAPTTTDAVIKLTNNPTVQTLAGVDQSATGFTTTFSDQLFFYVPAQTSSEKIRLLGYASAILDAKVIP